MCNFKWVHFAQDIAPFMSLVSAKFFTFQAQYKWNPISTYQTFKSPCHLVIYLLQSTLTSVILMFAYVDNQSLLGSNKGRVMEIVRSPSQLGQVAEIGWHFQETTMTPSSLLLAFVARIWCVIYLCAIMLHGCPNLWKTHQPAALLRWVSCFLNTWSLSSQPSKPGGDGTIKNTPLKIHYLSVHLYLWLYHYHVFLFFPLWRNRTVETMKKK